VSTLPDNPRQFAAALGSFSFGLEPRVARRIGVGGRCGAGLKINQNSSCALVASRYIAPMKATRKSAKQNDTFGINSGPKWGTPEHAAAEAAFFAEIEAENLAKYGRKVIPAMPLISDAEFNRLQSLAAKYR